MNLRSDSPDNPTDANEVLCEQFIGLILRMGSTMIAIAEERGLTKMQLFTLYAIADKGTDVPMSHVALVMRCDASNVTGIVDRLVNAGFLTRIESPRDRRTKLLTLTAKGTSLIPDVKRTLPDRLGCDRLAADEKCCLSESLTKMSDKD